MTNANTNRIDSMIGHLKSQSPDHRDVFVLGWISSAVDNGNVPDEIVAEIRDLLTARRLIGESEYPTAKYDARHVQVDTERLIAALQRASYSITEIAEGIGRSQSRISAWRNGAPINEESVALLRSWVERQYGRSHSTSRLNALREALALLNPSVTDEEK